MSLFAFRGLRTWVLGLLAVSVCFLGIPLRAQEKALAAPRSAYVNMETVFQGYYETVRSNEALSKQKDLYVQRANELAGQLDALKKARDASREKSLNIALTDEVRVQSRKEAEEKDLQARDKDKELREFVQGKDKELGTKHMELRNEIVKKLTDFIRTYAEKEQFETVTDVSGRTLNGISVMVYYPKDKDITDSVLTELNKGHESEIPKAAEAAAPVEPAKPAPEPVKAAEIKPPEAAKTPEATPAAPQNNPASAEPVKAPEVKPAPVEPAKPAPEPVKAPEVKPPEAAKTPEVQPVVPAEAAKPMVPKPAVAPAPVTKTAAPTTSSPVVRGKTVKPVPAAKAAVKPAAATPAKAASATVSPAKHGGFFSFSWLVFWRKSEESAPPEVQKTILAAPAGVKPAAATPAKVASATVSPAKHGGFFSFSWLVFWRKSKEPAPPEVNTAISVPNAPATGQ